jgi:signal transduction histidine kinase
VIDQKGMFWVNPAQPELVGKINIDLVDANGQRYIEKILTDANSGKNGFIQYKAYKPGSTMPSTSVISG